MDRPTRTPLERILEQGSDFHGSPAEEQDDVRGEAVAEVDLLESFLSGLLTASSPQARDRGIALVEEQFARAEAALSRASDHDVAPLVAYVSQLEDAYRQHPHCQGGDEFTSA